MHRLSLSTAVASILGKKDHEGYTDVGHLMTAKDLYKTLGLTGSPMLYNYMSGKTSTIEPERAKVFWDKFNILIDYWENPDDLDRDCTNVELSKKVAYEPIKEIVEELVKVEASEDYHDMKRGLRKLIARYY